MNTIEQTLNAGVPVTFPGGEQFHLLEADEPVDVTFYDNRNRPLETWEGMKGGFRLVFEKQFLQVKLESATGQTVKIALTSGRGQYDRSQGDVSITNIVKDNSWYYDAVNDKAFIGGGGSVAAASNYGLIQLLNPAASGYKLLCNRIFASVESATPIKLQLRSHDTALSTLAAIGPKYLGAGAGAGVTYFQVHTSMLGSYFNYGQASTYHPMEFIKKDPVVIDEGEGLLVASTVVNIAMIAMFEWTEIPV